MKVSVEELLIALRDDHHLLNAPEGLFARSYRDWVIDAFRRDLPYDKFVSWQRAGDQLPGATREQMLATSFLRMGKRNAEGGITDNGGFRRSLASSPVLRSPHPLVWRPSRPPVFARYFRYDLST